jgi:DNA-binding NarL/FixJ family response regulator
MTTRVFIVDDHELVRRGLATVIDAEPDMVACGSARDSQAALTMIRRLAPDLVIVDMSLKGNGSIDLIRKIRAFDDGIQILCLSMRDDPQNASKMIEAGAREYLVKQGVVCRVTDAIRRIRQNRRPVAEAQVDRPRCARPAGQHGATPPDLGLTETEAEIVELIGRGLPAQGIASVLHLSVDMVEIYRRNIMARLKLRDPARLVQFCVDTVNRRSADGSARGFGRPHEAIIG